MIGDLGGTQPSQLLVFALETRQLEGFEIVGKQDLYGLRDSGVLDIINETLVAMKIEVRRVNRLFPMVVLSDPFPSVTMLARGLLEREKEIAPVIWDLGVLDCAARIFAGDRQLQLLGVEPQRPCVVRRSQQDPGAQDLHGYSGMGVGWIHWLRSTSVTSDGEATSKARMVTAIRGAMRIGRVRAAVSIQSAASAADSAGRSS